MTVDIGSSITAVHALLGEFELADLARTRRRVHGRGPLPATAQPR